MLRSEKNKAFNETLETYIEKKFGNTTITGWHTREVGKKKEKMFRLTCDCGNKHESRYDRVLEGRVTRCNSCRVVNLMLKETNKY